MRVPSRAESEQLGVTGNRLLDTVVARLGCAEGAFSPLTLGAGAHLPQADVDDASVLYFPREGLLAELISNADGDEVELGLVGSEGFAPFLGLWTVPMVQRRIVALAETHVVAIRARALRALLSADETARRALEAYAFSTQHESLAGLLCNARHSAVQRLARLLLRVHDRVGNAGVDLSHDMLSQMLGVRRATVTTALHSLKTLRALSLRRRRVVVLDRGPLQTVACSCYAGFRARPRSAEATG